VNRSVEAAAVTNQLSPLFLLMNIYYLLRNNVSLSWTLRLTFCGYSLAYVAFHKLV